MLAACIEAYRRDPQRCAREGSAARALAERRYDRATVVDEWLGQLRELTLRA